MEDENELEAAAAEAADIAAIGPVSVVLAFTVTGPTLRDLRRQIRARLTGFAPQDDFDLRLTVTPGVVLNDGTIQSWQGKIEATIV